MLYSCVAVVLLLFSDFKFADLRSEYHVNGEISIMPDCQVKCVAFYFALSRALQMAYSAIALFKIHIVSG
jgi:hypothetical protein